MAFLTDLESRPFTATAPAGIIPDALFIGLGPMALEVAVFTATRRPTNPEVRQLHQERVGRRATPVVLAILWGTDRAAICGPAGDELAIVGGADQSQIERLCAAALGMPDRHAAMRFLSTALGQLHSPIPGLRNSGLFALHELQAGVPIRHDWAASRVKAGSLLSLRGRPLIEGLEFNIEALPGPESILVASGTKVAIALFLERPDEIEPASPRFDGISPISHALAKADQENLDYVVVTAGSTLRVYPVKPGIGTGRRGRTETYAEVNLDLLPPDQAGYLWLLFSARALGSRGSFTEILGRSADYAADLSGRLRDRVYHDVVPNLAAAIVKARRLRNPSPEKLRETYEMALMVLFRLLFVAYAEDKELLPLHQNAGYRKHSLKEVAKQLAEWDRGAAFDAQDFLWNEVVQLWKAVDRGNTAWGVPPYNGGLFASDQMGAGSELAQLTIPDKDFAPALGALLLDETAEETRGPIDFRSLGVREFGTIYEGLLESELSVAEMDLAIDPKTEAYIPVKGRAKVEVREGEVYLHNASGARKSTGAYYTKDFAVEHLLEHALEPALSDHLARLDGLYDPRDAAERFFDFHVADIAMGSGHFLVAAVDRIERRLSNYLAKRSLPGVKDELERLRRSAMDSLGTKWTGDTIEDTQLLRRQIARRCVFGVDLNPLAVELARLSIWIHTFVPGLPLSFLDGNLVVGNSLVGIATFEEARDALAREEDLFAVSADTLLEGARKPMERLARLAEATAAEVKEARKLYNDALRSTAATQDLFTVATASRFDEDVRGAVEERQVATRFKGGQGDVFSDALVRKAEGALAGLRSLHFPIAFPQVFLGARRGFDAIIGNPPWDKVRFEEDAFFVRHIPGLMGLVQAKRKVAIKRFLASQPGFDHIHEDAAARAVRLQQYFEKRTGAYKYQGSGHLDTAKLFLERMLNLITEDGRLGVVLPRQSLVLAGWRELREALFRRGLTTIAQLRNKGGWVFDEAEHRYVIVLVAVAKKGGANGETGSVTVYPGADSKKAWIVRDQSSPLEWSLKDLREAISSDLQIPLLTSPGEEALLSRLLRYPRLGTLDAGEYRGIPYAVIDVGKDLKEIGLDTKGTFLARTRSIGQFDFEYDAESHRVSSKGLERFLSKKIDGASWSQDIDWSRYKTSHELLSIAYRYPARNDDSRTVIATLLPKDVTPAVGYVHSLIMPRASVAQRLFVLGCLNSLAWDWVARRFIDRHVTSSVLQLMPLPHPDTRLDPLRVASYAAALLRYRTSAARLPSYIDAVRPSDESEEGCVVGLNIEVCGLLGITRAEGQAIMHDFSPAALVEPLRSNILDGLR